ncbi:MAG TPA: hypothetical protein VGD67_04020 [Pseudonocardiaceae bacterium]
MNGHAESTPCAWCGRQVDQPTGAGRRRRYCAQPCRQRAYEQRLALRRTGLPDDAVVLTAAEVTALHDRLFQLRCAAEDVATAVDDGASVDELRSLTTEVRTVARSLERLRG